MKKKFQVKVVSASRNPRAVAMQCGLCERQFSLKKRGDTASYNSAEYHRHLDEDHDVRLPKLVVVMDEGVLL